MSAKRKAPLAMADSNAPPAKRVTKGKAAPTNAGPASAKEYKYSDPAIVIDQAPVPITFLMWPSSNEDDDEEEDEDDEDDDEDDPDKPAPGSLQAQLDQIENEKEEACSTGFDEYFKNKGFISGGEVQERRKKISVPFDLRADIAREEAVKAGVMTAEQAKAMEGISDRDRKGKRKSKQRLQEKLNALQRERNAADDQAKAERRFLKEVKEVKEFFLSFPSMRLTAEDVKDMAPNIEFDDDGKEIPTAAQLKKEAARLEKEAEEKAFVAPRIVTDEGIPVSKAGMKKSFEIRQEVDNRDPDMHAMYIYNDFAGYGVTEVMENLLSEFNKVIFKKEVSPIEKWTIVEGITTYLHMGNHMTWMMNDDSEAVEEILYMLGIMFITSLEMLHESNLVGSTTQSPLPDNVGIMTLLFLDFMSQDCSDFGLDWLHEVVRAADKYGVVLTIPEPKKISITQKQLDNWRAKCAKRAQKKGMTWKGKYAQFKGDHPGGQRYDITKMSKAEQDKHKFSNMNSGSENEDDDDMLEGRC